MPDTPNLTIPTRDPRWQFWVQSTKPELEGKLGSTFALANGVLGLRGAHEEMPAWGRPEFYVTGTYAHGPASLLGFHDPDHILTHPQRITPTFLAGLGDQTISTLPNFPYPLAVRLAVAGVPFDWKTSKVLSCERLVEIDQALLRRRLVFRDAENRRTCVDAQRFVSFADRQLVALRYRVRPLDHDAAVGVSGYLKRDVANTNGVVLWAEAKSQRGPGLEALQCRTHGTNLLVAIAQQAVVTSEGADTVLDLFVIAGEMSLPEAIARAQAAAARGYPELLAEHQVAWRAETAGAALCFDDNPATVQGFNFGQMHLHMAFCYGNNRVGIPIKGLTGHGYRFANFWDMDFHMFPYYLATKPEQAHLLLEYRYNQLPVYRENARRWGAKGAQVPWETQVAGDEVTAPWLCLQEREIHISADAAYMFKLYDELTPNHQLMVDMGAEFILETARFYASRLRWSAALGKYELPDIGCPDQYHTFADNNVFISLWARWNLEYAIGLAENPEYAAAVSRTGLAAEELATWKKMVAAFHIIQPNAEGIIEEFDGFFMLAPDMDGICETYCVHTQAVKQPDVLAAFGPFEALYDRETRVRNWHFYNARTLHGSSLSLPGMALSAARCGLNDEALYNLHKSTRMDLDDVNLDTERGVHVSGGAVEWSTLVFGFGGLELRREGLQLRPNLPRQWRQLRFTVHWQFQRIQVLITRDAVEVTVGERYARAVPVSVNGQPPRRVPPGKTELFVL